MNPSSLARIRFLRHVVPALLGWAITIGTVQASQVFPYRGIPKKGHLLSAVPYERWIQRIYCGPACLLMVLRYCDAGRSLNQELIAAQVMDPERLVSFNSELVYYTRNLGLAAIL